MPTMTDHGASFAAHCDATHCIEAPSLQQAIAASLQWWAKGQRWLAMEADVFALQKIAIEAPKAAGEVIEAAAFVACVGVTPTDERVRGAFQLFPSQVWVQQGHTHYVDYRALNASTRGTTDRALVCCEPSGMPAAILTNDGAAAAWLRAQLEATANA